MNRVTGHIDRIDEAGVTGWAAGGLNGVPHVVLKVSGVPRDAEIEPRERPDVATIYGPSALKSGFFISLRGIAPDDPTQLPAFFSKVEIRADGELLKPSKGATVPTTYGKKGLSDQLHVLKHALVHRSRESAISKSEYRRYFLEPRRAAKAHGRDLSPVDDRTHKIQPSDILAFVTARNEVLRLPYFLNYYRNLGVRHFLFVDNGSTDGSIEYLRNQLDCSIWHTASSYKGSNFGMDWMNHLLGRHGVGHWCLTLDPDELLVFPYCEDRNLYELTEFLQSIEQYHLFCLLLDMYSDRRINQTIYRTGQNPLEIAPYFDEIGYVQRTNASFGETFVQGGPRRRIFFRDQPEKAPALNKTPLVKWQADYNYISSTHMLSSKAVNRPHKPGHLSTTGCLLHFKFISAMTDKVAEEIERKEHYDNSVEYRSYHDAISRDRDILFFERSRKYVGSRQLCDHGFMSRGSWF